MTELEKQGLRGPVRKVRRESFESASNTVYEWVFDRDGKCLSLAYRNPDGSGQTIEYQYDEQGNRLDPSRQVIRSPDGSWTELFKLAEVRPGAMSGWTMEGLHDCTLSGWGATLARTEFNRQGRPIETVFEDSRNKRLHRIRYVCDDEGRILEAVQNAEELSLFDLIRQASPPDPSLDPVWKALKEREIPSIPPTERTGSPSERSQVPSEYFEQRGTDTTVFSV